MRAAVETDWTAERKKTRRVWRDGGPEAGVELAGSGMEGAGERRSCSGGCTGSGQRRMT